MTLWSVLETAVRNWASRDVERPFNGYVAQSGGQNAIATGTEFVSEASYFSVRMVEMSLRQGGQFFTSFLPLGVVLSEFSFGANRQRRPTILSNDDIAAQLKSAGATPGYIEFTNIYAVRRAPVRQDNLSLFVGLFRLPHDDVAKQVLQLAADLTAQTGLAPGVSEGVRIAEKVYDGVAGLFHLNGVTPLFSFANGNALTRSGYLLVAGSALDRAMASRMSVIDNKLELDGQRVTGLDYCLLAIEHTATLLPDGPDSINPLTQLGFHQRWRDVALSLTSRKLLQAEEQMITLRAELLTSPELVENDRLVAMGAYETSYDKLVERMTPKGTHRGGTRAPLLTGLPENSGSGTAATQVLGGVRRRLLAGVSRAPDDPDKLFAMEASELRKSLAGTTPVNPEQTASLANALGGALGRR